MKDIISVFIGQDHFFECSVKIIARTGENIIPRLEITIPTELSDYWAYIDFKKANGEKFKTPRIEIADSKIAYDIPLGVLDKNGDLEVQVVLQKESGEIWKSTVKTFCVHRSIDAVDDIPNKEDFITEAQKILDDITSGGGGSGGSITVDQTYNPTSENAQSGKAVAEAIGDIETAIDNIIAIQNSLIGGDGV